MQTKHRAISNIALSAALAILAAVALSACGFQLRGTDAQSSLPFKTIYLDFPETSSLGTELKRYIRASGDTQMVADAHAAQVLLAATSEIRDKVILSLNSQGRVREYTLYYKLQFLVKDHQGKDLLPSTEIVLKREISFNEAQVLAKEAEEALLYRDMQSDMVQQLLRRLAAIKLQ